MKPFIRIAFPTGQLYELETALVAGNRAKSMLETHPSEFPTLEAAMEDTVGYFTDGNERIEDWAQNNMNWNEIEPHARLIRFTPQPLDHVNDCEWSHHDDRGLMAELSDNMSQMPVELVMNTMALQNQLCNITVMQHESQPFAMLAMVIGSKPVLDTYIQAMEFTTNMLQKPALPVNTVVPAVQLIH